MSTKGSWQRPDVDKNKFNEEYDRIFKKKKGIKDKPKQNTDIKEGK